ncbi:MAG: glycoside hydrolase family 16 protein [Nanoarchaeota archaeon]
MWRLRDFIINTFLRVRLWTLIKLSPKRFKGVLNQKIKKDWELTFGDEFDGKELNREKWRTDSYYGLRFHPGNIVDHNIAPVTYYSDDCFEFENSIMRQIVKNEFIEIDYTDWDDNHYGKFKIPYQIGQIDSSNFFEQKYGYFEIRSKTTAEPGSWPAFWLASTKLWPPEIDVYEIYTGKRGGLTKFSSNFHWKKGGWDRSEKNHKSKVKSHKVMNTSEDFHTYAVEWNKNRFKIYYDNVLVRVFSNPKALSFFRFPMHVIIGTGINEHQNPEKAKYPNYHEVDYVRVYKKK